VASSFPEAKLFAVERTTPSRPARESCTAFSSRTLIDVENNEAVEPAQDLHTTTAKAATPTYFRENYVTASFTFFLCSQQQWKSLASTTTTPSLLPALQMPPARAGVQRCRNGHEHCSTLTAFGVKSAPPNEESDLAAASCRWTFTVAGAWSDTRSRLATSRPTPNFSLARNWIAKETNPIALIVSPGRTARDPHNLPGLPGERAETCWSPVLHQ
jgi:hypothetical protein